MSQRFVKDLLRVRHSHVVTEDVSLREVAERLMISDCDVVAVTDQNQRLTGIVCESAVVRALLANPAPGTTIRSIVTNHAASVRLDASLDSVLPLFRTSAHTAVPVVDLTDRVCGLLMRRDVIGSILNHRIDDAQPVAGSESVPVRPRPPLAFPRPSNSVRPTANSPATDSPHADGSPAEHPPAVHPPASGDPLTGPHFLRADAARRILWASEDRL